jgi:hypothetical protein
MTLRIVGAGVGRTGTLSLKLALERLLDAPCYHMTEVFRQPGHVGFWREAVQAVPRDWSSCLDGYAATLDWPAAAFWPELSEAYPDALVLLSHRDPAAWWRSASATIFPAIAGSGEGEWGDMMTELLRSRFGASLERRESAMAAYRSHVKDVRRRAPPGRLVEWQPGDGWRPLCRALGVGMPEAPFPHANATADFLARRG